MLSTDKRTRIHLLMQQEIIPSIGCTEPVAVALCTAKACSVLGRKVEKVEAFLSANVLKNALGVGIPGTGMTGLPIAIALGALTGKPEEGLELLKLVTPEEVEQGTRFIEEGRIEICQQTGITDKLYIRIRCSGGGESAVSVISGNHNHFTYIEKNGEVLLDDPIIASKEDKTENDVPLNFRTVYEYAVDSPVEELSFILEAARMNRKASGEAMLHSYGHNVAGSLKNRNGLHVFGDNLHTRMVISTAGACDMRMDGGLIPVMSNSGSGNQGIAATMPILTYAESESCSEEQLIRALTLSSLLIIYIKQQLGRLSALCGCVVASTGSSCGITYLMGGTYDQIVYAAKNMIANITGMICDGAKPGCALKIASGVSTAALSAVMAMENEVVTSQEGIVDEDIDRTIENLARIGNSGMQETDQLVLDIMTKK
ncbi:serine dehydratase subunit alpha family protein [Proteiniphilum acetatigenes]|uniref:L-cysteine desulfidase family protein n=1 Tax=Proteiniphilum acetatigenes TaxID=294710 RepID=UPI0004780D08|nr:L-serine ammonia-lyase, iron-sulfur-dependent, subunit alpha [Proteiniphilum acetatigenes]